MNARIWVVQVTSEDGDDINVYRTKRGADRYVAAVKRRAKDDEDINTHAIAWPERIREEGEDPQ